MADTKTDDRRDSGANLTNQRSSSRPGSITRDGKDINTPQTQEQRMEGVETTVGHQGSQSHDYQSKPDENSGGFGMQDTDRRPGDRANANSSNTQTGALPQHDGRYSSDEDRSRSNVSAQPGQNNANVKDEHPERPGHDTPEGKAQTGKGNDERGEYGKGSTDTQPETAGGG